MTDHTLNDLQGPEMMVNVRLREQIYDFQQFLVRDIWTLSSS